MPSHVSFQDDTFAFYISLSKVTVEIKPVLIYSISVF